jgi:hypothetical protein
MHLICVYLCSEDGSGGEGYMSSPSLVWVTEDGSLAIGDMPSVGGYRGRRAALQPKHTLPLALSESVLQVKLIRLALCQGLCFVTGPVLCDRACALCQGLCCMTQVRLLCMSFVLSWLPTCLILKLCRLSKGL